MVHKKRNGFRQITQEERVEIGYLIRGGVGIRAIGRELGRHHTTISREIERNGIDCGRWRINYKPLEAEKKRRERKHKANRLHVKLRKNIGLQKKILHMLETTWWWPDEILWRLKYEWWRVVSTATLYRWIHLYRPRRKMYLLHKSLKYNKKYVSKKWGNYKDIPLTEVRESEFITREETWHTESDSIICGSGIWWLTVNVDRCSRYTRMRKIADLKWRTVYRAMKRMLKKWSIKSITIDNGVEFSQIRLFTWCKLYRCHAYSSREKWTVENTNGIIRRRMPKWSIISEYTDEEIQKIEDAINHKPRKILGYRTPYEVHHNIYL